MGEINLSRVQRLQNFGQSVWLDYIRRSLITGGELASLVEKDGLRGVTSNPTIFQKAIEGSSDYDDTIRASVLENLHLEPTALLEKIIIKDIQMAADILRPIYDKTNGSDGFVSLELSPRLARNTKASIKKALRLWKMVDRPNLMLKVPATKEGLPVIEHLISKNINVNITLIFSLSQYESVVKAYIKGLNVSSNPRKVASVASFFVSRIDTAIDKILEKIGNSKALNLKGKTAIANSKLAYKRFQDLFKGEEWDRLLEKGANVQRVLWASTSTKTPSYSDVRYVEELIGPNTVNTMPPSTLNAFRDHGRSQFSLVKDLKKAKATLKELEELGVNLDAVTNQLLEDGLKSFLASYEELLSSLESKRQLILQGHQDLHVFNIGKYQTQVNKRLKKWTSIQFLHRLWRKDPTLWFSESTSEITDRLGWLELPEVMHEPLSEYIRLTKEVQKEGIEHIVLLGMGGSSLAPHVFAEVFKSKKGYPKLIVLDSTHPSTILSVETTVDLKNTLFLVASKSGSTTETISLFKYFWRKIEAIDYKAGRYFVAITDPNTPLEELARAKKFRKIFRSPPEVGGRYSALTVFGLLPASLIGINIHEFLDKAWITSENCAFCTSPEDSISLTLAATLGELATNGIDKATFLVSPSLSKFPIWLEQLIAESTGKNGKGIIPIVDEPVTSPTNYDDDRFFIYFSLIKDNQPPLEAFVSSLENLEYPVIRITLPDKLHLSQEIFSWEIAVAGAGAILGIHPFNQPNVQMAKDLAQKMMSDPERNTSSKNSVKTVSIDDVTLLSNSLKNWLSQSRKGDYFAIQAYLPQFSEMSEKLKSLQSILLSRTRLATTVGYGPRFLHSTGQLHKGGANKGLFLQLIDEPKIKLAVPETPFTFGELIQAQAIGDYLALKQLNRRILRINLGRTPMNGLSFLYNVLKNLDFDNVDGRTRTCK